MALGLPLFALGVLAGGLSFLMYLLQLPAWPLPLVPGAACIGLGLYSVQAGMRLRREPVQR